MRYVALGDLVADCYYRNIGYEKELVKVDGGSSRFNVIANLASRGCRTAVISACGLDLAGRIALHSLMKLNVDASYVMRKREAKTRCYHLLVEGDKHVSTRICPVCGSRTWYEPIATIEYCRKWTSKNDILILDGLKPENIPIITAFSNEKVLDIGRTKRLQKLSNQEILNILQNRNIEILQLNESVEKYLMQRFEIAENDLISLFKLLKVKFMIVTRGQEGADFVVENHIIHKSLIYYKTEIDDTGAGDAFFSMFIQKYYENNKKVTRPWLDATFFLANKLTADVVSHLGARGHLYDGYYPEHINNCICNTN